MTRTQPLGPILHSFFLDHLITVKGLRPASVRSYRDTIRLLLCFVAADKRSKITRLTSTTSPSTGSSASCATSKTTAATTSAPATSGWPPLHTLFDYIATREPEMLGVCQRVAAIPMKRAAPAETRFLERDEIAGLLRHLPTRRAARAARPCPDPVPLQHRRPGPGSRRPAGRAPRPRRAPAWSACTARATNGGPARSGSRPAQLLTDLLNDAGRPTDQPTTPVFISATGRAADPLRHLQDRAPPRRPPRRPPHRPHGQPAHSSGTPRPSTCSKPASRSTSSAAGSGTPT